jgi:hypothetical protein
VLAGDAELQLDVDSAFASAYSVGFKFPWRPDFCTINAIAPANTCAETEVPPTPSTSTYDSPSLDCTVVLHGCPDGRPSRLSRSASHSA